MLQVAAVALLPLAEMALCPAQLAQEAMALAEMELQGQVAPG